jgi:ABC-type transport system involved in cytochrome c biogenesis permease component
MVWLTLLLSALMLSEVAWLLVSLAEQVETHKLLLWLVLAPLGVILLYPAVYAKELFEACLETIHPFFKSFGEMAGHIWRRLFHRKYSPSNEEPTTMRESSFAGSK